MTAAATDPALLAAEDMLRLFRTRHLSPVEVLDAVLARIGRFDETVNAFCHLDEDGARAQAKASEARWAKGRPIGLIDGVPTTIKDLVLVRGWPTLRGSLTIARDQDWADDAPQTARLREHGAVLIGKTTTPEFGWKGVTDSRLTGVTRNPWDTGRTPGGSSGGAAVAAALAMGTLHTGSDGGGSIRMPSGFTGIFGHKPSFGRVPHWPASPFGPVSHQGPMTRHVRDAALMLTVMALPDSRDWTALPHDPRDWRIGLEDGVRGMWIGWCPDLGFGRLEPEVAALTEAAAMAFEELGAHVERVPPPIGPTSELFRTIWFANAAALARGMTAEQRAKLDPGLQEVIAAGADIDLARYQDALAQRVRVGEQMNAFHRTYDLLLTPTLPLPAFPAGQELADPSRESRWIDWSPYSYPFNLSTQPACSVPCGLTEAGLPMGLQIVGPMHDDARVLRAARAFEAIRPWPFPEAPRTPA